ncbi:MAG: amidohydrolase family protein [Bryobacterales bacterium]|nr:amidohydrolase family protein [Bryobacterales bacterium]
MRFLPLFLFAAALFAQPYDFVLRGGRVIDPETGLSAVRDVGIARGRIAAVSGQRLDGRTVLDVAGLVVAPGFIDLHAHGQDDENHRYQAMDGVTTALELEVGTGGVAAWYAAREGKRRIHSGVSVGHVPVRRIALRDTGPGLVPGGEAARAVATAEQISDMRRLIEKGLQEGALGTGFGVQYVPGASRWEILEMFRVSGRFRAPAYVHIRHMGDAEPSSAMIALQEVIAAAAVTGTPLHVVHITSSGLDATDKLLRTIADARAQGLDITTECYPYTAAMTELQSAMFNEGWQKVLGIDFGGLEWVQTGERLNAESFARYRKVGGMVIMHMIPEPMVNLAIASPLTIIASDGVIANGKGHPRGAGTYARLLGYYVRERKLLDLETAVAKATLWPARRLETYVPAMKRKGRLQEGADADITVFDPATVRDKATFANPAQYSEGIRHVFVAGQPVVRDGKLVENVFPGQAVRR